MDCIELFAGCGGLSLGLSSIGFNLVFANEISPMASETFSYNFFKEDLTSLAEKNLAPKHTLWLGSNFNNTTELKKRLRENPKDFPLNNLNEINSNTIKDSIIVGDIIQLNEFLKDNPNLIGDIDLVSGGPPCQSFSLAGLRQHGNARNSLPLEFANFINIVKPKIALLENVSGILRPFKIEGNKYYAWLEVAKAFTNIDYIPICLHVNAKYTGVPQSRPRFIMLALRKDIFLTFQKKTTLKKENNIFSNSLNFFKDSKNNLNLYEVEKDLDIFKDTFLSPLVEYSRFHTVFEALTDLEVNKGLKSNYTKSLGTLFGESDLILNNEQRKNSILVKQRFRIYQILNEISTESRKKIIAFLRLPKELSTSVKEELHGYKFYTPNQEYGYIPKEELQKFLTNLITKKRSQKALDKDKPAPTVLSIPDDVCHYNELRTLTVREMARLQSFPDSFTFKSKVTTGGKARKFEVPQYTQVGNAVPPLLGRALGKVVQNLIGGLNES